MEDIVHKAQANNYRLGGIKFKQHLIQVVGEKKKNLLGFWFLQRRGGGDRLDLSL